MSTSAIALTEDLRLLEASEWVLRLQGVDVDEQTTIDWLEWCQSDQANFDAFEQMRALWRNSQALNVAAVGSPPPFRQRAHYTTTGSASAAPKHFLQRVAAGRYSLPMALAAALLIALGAWMLLTPVLRDASPYSQTLRTGVAALNRQKLPDGSSVELGARSVVRVELTGQRRSIFVEAGEAYFDVAKDRDRPFVVQAGDLQVVAIGTAFNVRKTDNRVVVTVAEGVVRVAPHERRAGEDRKSLPVASEFTDGQVRAGAGHQIVYSMPQRSLSMTNVEPKVAAAWRTGRLEFVNEPLGAVISDLNRYSQRRISLAGENLEGLVFTGTLRGDAIDDWLKGLEEVFPLTAVDRGADGILLTERE